MTGLETGLGGGILALGMFIVGRVSNFRTVKKDMCLNTHESLTVLLEEKFKNIDDKLTLILDK